MAIKAILVALFLSVAGSIYGLDIHNVIKTLNSDFEIVFAVNPKRSASIFSKYIDKRDKYRSIFRQILSNRNEYSDETAFNVINAIAISQDSNLLENVKSISSAKTNMNDVIYFYYYRIGYKKEKSFDYLKKRLSILASSPTDSHLITFLPFLDDVDVSLSFLNKLMPGSDGAMAELLSWAIDYLYFMNRHNEESLSKIRMSPCYKALIQNNSVNVTSVKASHVTSY